MVDAIHEARGTSAAIIINPGAFTHYAWSIHDALAAFDGPIVEVHISNPNAREPWRHTSVIAPVSTGSIMGFGMHGYKLAVEAVAAQVEFAMMPPLEVAERCQRVPRRDSDQAEALLISDLTNIRWLTGFTGSNGWVVLTAADVVLVTDGRYGDQATAQLAQAGVDGHVIVGLSGAAMLDAAR